MHAALDISRLIDERSLSPLQWLVAFGCAMAMFLDGYEIQVMALAVPSLAQEWSIEPARFGLALSAVLLGLGVGGAFIAPLGDRLGRRTVLIIALLLGGLATLATATATSPAQFVIWRLLTGIGIGASVPNCNAWTSEYMPARRRATLLVLMNAAVGAGAFVAGIVAPYILTRWGWRGTFLVGGAAPLLVAVLLYFCAPESIQFLLARRPQDPRIPAILKRLAPDIEITSLQEARVTVTPRASITALLNAHYRARTLVLWTVVLINLFTLYFLISWLPTLLQSAGWRLDSAIRGAVLIQAGGIIGGVGLSFWLDAGKTQPALLVAFMAAAGCLALFAVVPAGSLWIVMLLVIGGGVSGTQLSLNALSTAYYPPAIKATGMSWVGVVGTIGSFVAPMAGSWAIGSIAPASILATLAIPPLLCAAAVLMMRREWQLN